MYLANNVHEVHNSCVLTTDSKKMRGALAVAHAGARDAINQFLKGMHNGWHDGFTLCSACRLQNIKTILCGYVQWAPSNVVSNFACRHNYATD
jgi:hypothetical protein